MTILQFPAYRSPFVGDRGTPTACHSPGAIALPLQHELSGRYSRAAIAIALSQ
ncbi:hypothetical protein [Oxynema aestuarii]|uniref:hypothetical protein n=1 Tax=Oxynema aestuarii TaxID=2874213 RepID=UPI001B306592|nr:hypothetical protein [Oxynema aestuarii]